jgi:hypothetical protein
MPEGDKVIQDFVQGHSVTQISRDLGLSREHVARSIQPRALGLVAFAFLQNTSLEALAPADRSVR